MVRASLRTLPLLALLAGCAASGPDAASDDDEVNVGYGTTPASRVTGAVTRYEPDEAARASAQTVEDLIVGRVPGVVLSPETGRLVIRGANSLNGPNDPLYVVDGLPLSGGSSGVAPADVASIEVLKDAGATALYGSRGANGVILITTRRGRE